MKKLGLMVTVFILVFSFSCSKHIEKSEAQEIHELIQSTNPEALLPIEEIEVALSQASTGQPCKWDFDYDGVIGSNDLVEFLSRFGDPYTASDLADLLAYYGSSYIVDIIPSWNNFIQDVTPVMNSYSKILCNGQVIVGDVTSQPTIVFDETNWLYDNTLVWSGVDLVNTVLDNEGNVVVQGWDNPCNGTKPLTLEIVHNGYIYRRTANSWISYFSQPETCSDILGLTIVDAITDNSSYFPNTFQPYEFCVNCN